MRSVLVRAKFEDYRVKLLVLVLLGLLWAPSARTEEPPVFALSGARIVPVSAAPLEKGTVVIRNGIIEAVGRNVPVPPDARVIDCAEFTVYPGLIDALSDIGLEESRSQAAPASPSARGQPSLPAQQPPAQQPPSRAFGGRQILNPYAQAADLIQLTDRKIERARAAGITTALVAPRRGVFQGRSSLLNLSGASVGEMVVKTPVAMHISLQSTGGSGGGYPASLMGVLAYVKQTLLDTRHYETAWRIYHANPGSARPSYDRSLEALQPVLNQEMPVVLPGDTPAQIQRAIQLAQSFKLRMILSGGAQAAKKASLLKAGELPVLVAVRFPERERDADPDQEEELEELRRRVEAPANAAALAREGVRFAFQSGDTANPRDFIRSIIRTIEAGLDKDLALRALTLTPAEIFGVADRMGSIEKGKAANLTVATGDIFDPRTHIKHVFIDGKKFDITEPEEPNDE